MRIVCLRVAGAVMILVLSVGISQPPLWCCSPSVGVPAFGFKGFQPDPSGYGACPVRGEVGFYHEEKDFNRDRFVEDDEMKDLPDERFTAAFLKLDYETPDFYNIRLAAGVTGYLYINDFLPPDPEQGTRKDVLLRELYLEYRWADTAFRLGRQEIDGTTFEEFYFAAFSIASIDWEKVDFIFVAARKTAEVDLPDIIDFRDVDFGNSDLGQTYYIAEVTWRPFPDTLTLTPYYQGQADLFDLYGAHVEFAQEVNTVIMGLAADYYGTREDRKNGIVDAEGRVSDTNIFHIKPYLNMGEATVAVGYMKADRRVGAREGDLIDDYFNPFNEGDMIYQPGARTWFGEFFWEWDRFNVELVYGDTDYNDGLQTLNEREFDIRAAVALGKHLTIQADFARVDSESPEGSFHKFETELTYAF